MNYKNEISIAPIHIYNPYLTFYNSIIITIKYDIFYEEGFFMPADNEKKYTQKTSTESVNNNGSITVDEIDEINAIQNNIRKNLEFFKKKLDLSDDKELACCK